MPIKYRVLPKINSRKFNAEPKSFALAVSDGMVDIDLLPEHVADGYPSLKRANSPG